jgi:hypothetical protein
MPVEGDAAEVQEGDKLRRAMENFLSTCFNGIRIASTIPLPPAHLKNFS